MIVDWQHEPIKGKLLHIDLKRIAMNKTMRVSVPVLLSGIPVGVKVGAACSTRFCAKSKSSACRLIFRITSTWMSLSLSSTARSTSAELPHSGSIKFIGDETALVAHVTLDQGRSRARSACTGSC